MGLEQITDEQMRELKAAISSASFILNGIPVVLVAAFPMDDVAFNIVYVGDAQPAMTRFMLETATKIISTEGGFTVVPARQTAPLN